MKTKKKKDPLQEITATFILFTSIFANEVQTPEAFLFKIFTETALDLFEEWRIAFTTALNQGKFIDFVIFCPYEKERQKIKCRKTVRKWYRGSTKFVKKRDWDTPLLQTLYNIMSCTSKKK